MSLKRLLSFGYQAHGALDLGSTRFLKNMISMKNEGTAEVFEGTEEVHEGTAQVNESTAEVNESTAEKIKLSFTMRCSLIIPFSRQGDDYISTSGEALAL
ncbi:hypothetical protein Tco_0326968 [Tanacetum coccineum]